MIGRDAIAKVEVCEFIVEEETTDQATEKESHFHCRVDLKRLVLLL